MTDQTPPADGRLEDYLNDKLQTASDFQTLDSLIDNVELQRKQLQDQLQDAQKKLAQAKQASSDHSKSIVTQTQEFQELQKSIDERARLLTTSEATEDAVSKLRGPMEKLRRLELARSYVELLKEVNDLAEEARSHLPAHPKEALKPYARLKQLAISLRSLQGAAEGAAVHLVTYVNDTASQLWTEMKKIMSDEFEAVLKKTNWPVSREPPSQQWSDCFDKLLDLQAPEFVAITEPVVLLPMAVLTKTFSQQFRYNFMGSKPNIAKGTPNIFFDWFLSTVHKWEDYLQENVGPVLANHFRGSNLANNSLFIDAVSAFITAYLPVLREHINTSLPGIAKDPRALSGFMYQLMAFDEALREDFSYDGGDPEQGWPGLTSEVLNIWFEKWLDIEKTFALSRYQQILNSKDNGLIDYDSAGLGKTKATFGATRVTDLLANTTQLYEKVRNFSQKIRFLIDIQLSILDQYHNRLRDSLDAYQAITSTVARTLHGVSKEQQAALEGVGGLESLCKVYGSSEHVILTLRDWSNSIFFIDLWAELQSRAQRANVGDNLAGPKSFTDVKNSTSASVGSGEDGALFDESSKAFELLRKSSEALMIQAIKYDFPRILKPYLNKPQWTTVDAEADNASPVALLSVTAELDQPLQVLNKYMDFLHKTLAEAPFRRIWREVLDGLQDLLWHDILMKSYFTSLGAAQLLRDLHAVWEIIDRYISEGSSSSLGMPLFAEGVRLLNTPLNPHEGVLSLKEVNDRIFMDNAEAKKVMEELGLSVLDYTAARAVIQRRVEFSDL